MTLDAWLMANILRLLPTVIGLVCAFSGVQLVKSAQRSYGRAPLDNFALRRIAFYVGTLAAGIAWGELFEYSRVALWVGLGTGLIAPLAWAVVMGWLSARYPGLYAALRSERRAKPHTPPAPSGPGTDDDTTWYGPR